MVMISGRVVGFVALAGVAIAITFALTRPTQVDERTPASKPTVASASASIEATTREVADTDLVASARRGEPQSPTPAQSPTRALGDGHGGFPDDWRDGIDPPEGLDPARLRAFYESSLANEERVAARLERSLEQSRSRDAIEVELAVARARRDEVRRRLEQLP
jgi:hypothetical protein